MSERTPVPRANALQTRGAGAPGCGGPQLSKAEALRRLHRLKRGTTTATVLGFGALGWLVHPPLRAMHARGAARAAQAPQVAPSANTEALTVAASTPVATASATVTALMPVATTSAPASATSTPAVATRTAPAAHVMHATRAATRIRPSNAARKPTAQAAHKHAAPASARTSIARKTPAPTVTATAVASTATPVVPTATPVVPTATPSPRSGFFTQGQGGQGNGIGSASPAQTPVAQSGAS